MEFDGKVVVVTGGASGIGRATARRFASLGARVVVGDVSDPSGRETAELIRADGGEARYRHTDVTLEADVEALMADAVDAFGRLDVAFNNAGAVGAYGPTAELSLDDWRRIVDVNLSAVFLCIKAEIPRLLASGGGAIVNNASGAGLIGFAGLPAYVATKHGVVGLTKSVALEHAQTGIRVNAVCPGSVRTPMLRAFAGDDRAMEKMGAIAPMGRLGTPEEVAEAVVWLASERASFLTGVALPVDGGVMAR